MMRKLTALLLTVALVLSSLFTLGMTASAGGADYTVVEKVDTVIGSSVANQPASFTVDKDSFDVEDTKTHTIKWRINTEGNTIKSLKWKFEYDSKKLQIVKASMPQLTSAVGQIDLNTAGVVNGTASKADGFTLKADQDFITIELKMNGDGTVVPNVTLTLTELTYDFQSPLTVTVNTSTTAISDENMPKEFKFTGKTPSVYNEGSSFTLYWTINTDNKWVDSMAWSLNYDSTYLKVDKDIVPQISVDDWSTSSSTGSFSASMSKTGGFLPNPGAAIIAVTFKALKTGSTTVSLSLDDITYTKYYTVKFNTNGGTEIKDQSVRNTLRAYKPEAPKKEGYKFVNWYEDAGLTIVYGFKAVTKDTTVYAKWEPIVYDATFIARGKPVKTVKYTVETTSIENPPVPERKGFSGKWQDYTLEIGGTTIIAEYTLTANPVVTINDYQASRTVIYHQTQKYAASVADRPDDTDVHWFVDGKDVGTSDKYMVEFATEDYEIQAKLIDNDNGNVLAASPVANVHVVNNWLIRMIVLVIESVLSAVFHLSLPGIAVYYHLKSLFGF